MKIVFIGAGSYFGARIVVDLLSFPELRSAEIVLVDINKNHLDPVLAYSRKVAAANGADPQMIVGALDWRDGVLDGADYVFTAFSEGGPAYTGIPYYYEICVPQQYGIYQMVADTTGIGSVFRTMRTAPELLAIGQDMEKRCPGSYLLNYVNPMAMLTRILNKSCPKIHTIGLCHNIQNGIRDIARWLGVTHKDLRYECAGINHMDWFIKLEYAVNGKDAYPDLIAASKNATIYKERSIQFDLLENFGYFTTESAMHCAEYLPYYLHLPEERQKYFSDKIYPLEEVPPIVPRWTAESDLVKQINGELPLDLTRSLEYGSHIIHARETDTVYRMHVNVMNNGLMDDFSMETCVEVGCTMDRNGLHPQRVGRIPVSLAALCRGMADMQTLASDAFIEKDLNKAFLACLIDPNTAASATPANIRACFNKLLELDRKWLERYWGDYSKI